MDYKDQTFKLNKFVSNSLETGKLNSHSGNQERYGEDQKMKEWKKLIR